MAPAGEAVLPAGALVGETAAGVAAETAVIGGAAATVLVTGTEAVVAAVCAPQPASTSTPKNSPIPADSIDLCLLPSVRNFCMFIHLPPGSMTLLHFTSLP